MTPAPYPAIAGGRPLFAEPVPIARPALPDADSLAVELRSLVESGRLTNGETVERFERAAAQFLGVEHCVAVSSCTSGLMLVERAMGLRGRVIVPSFTFFATAHSLLWNQLEPVLVDCDPVSWNLDPEAVERVLRRSGGIGISAILAVHVYGNPAAAEELEWMARRAGVALLFDAAHAFGARRAGRQVGGFGDAEVFSFSPTKPLAAGEGGLVATGNPELARRLRAARNYGDSGDYDCRLLGLNARMTEMGAALALAALPLVEEGMAHRNRLARIYEEYLGSEPGLGFQGLRRQDLSTRKDFSILVDEARFGVSAPLLAQALAAENVQTRRYFDPPLHRQRLYARYWRPQLDPLDHTERLSRGVLSLPIHTHLSEAGALAIARRMVEIRDWLSGRAEPEPAQRESAGELAVEAIA